MYICTCIHTYIARYVHQWEDKVYVDLRLLQSAPFIFSSVADALLWIMVSLGQSTTWKIFLQLGHPSQMNVKATLISCTLSAKRQAGEA